MEYVSSRFLTRFFLALLCVLNLALLSVWFGWGRLAYTAIFPPQSASTVSHPELQDLAGTATSFSELQDYFKKLAEKKGGEYAFSVLRSAILPPNIDLHLLGHAVGDVLYKQKGVNGMRVCTNDFRNACSHSIVIGLFSDKGEQALKEIADGCRNAPGGKGAYTMCFHGLGHGMVAYAGYDLQKGMALCKKTGTAEYNNREEIECIGGSIMELISGGFHDRNLWAAQRKRYFSREDPLSPCNSDFMPENSRGQCYNYLTPYLWEVAGADIGNPTEQDFIGAFRLCAKMPVSEVGERDACFGGFGKEFVGVVQGRDIRMGSIERISDEKLAQIYTWCRLAPDARGTTICSEQALAALYWGGENNRSVTLRYCAAISNSADRNICYDNLIGAVSFYIKDQKYRVEFCSEAPEEYLERCQARLRE